MGDDSVYMGLDLSLTGTGICVVSDNGEILEQSTCGYGMKKTATVRQKMDRMLFIAKNIIKAINRYDDKTISLAVEGYAWGAKGRQFDLAELRGVVVSQICLTSSIKPFTVSCTAARRLVFGAGNTKKKLVIPLLTEMGYEFCDHNAADAYVIAEASRKLELENGNGSSN